jgi:cytochrome c oxidase subunit 3
MADQADATQLVPTEWGGGVLPFAVGHKKLGMWLFILSDSLTFSALLIGYSYVRVGARDWPKPFHFWPSVVTATIMTLVLLSSSLTMVMGVGAAKRGQRRMAVWCVLLTMLGGLAFIVLHLNEWLGLIGEGVRLWQNPWGVPLFGATFFTLTGLHMTHVATGVIYLGVVAIGFGKGRFTDEDVEVSGLYWHFVDLVWMFIFPLVYLLSVGGK